MIKQFKIIWKKFFKVLLSNIIIISLGVSLLFGSMNGLSSVHISMDKFLKENHYPDIRIITNIEDQELINNFNEEEYKNLDSRLSISTILKKEKEIISVKASTYTDQNNNDFYVWKEQKNNSGNYDISVEKKFSENNNINLGDTLSLRIGEDYYKFNVSKIVSIPEAMVNIPVNGLWGNINDYGNVYIHKNVLEKETNKLKQKYLNELNEKEEEIYSERNKKLEEYSYQKELLQNAELEYNKEYSNYQNVKEELNDKSNELQNNKEKLLELRQDYLEIINKIDSFSSLIDTYIDNYNNLSEEAKNYIIQIINEKYPDPTIEDVEFISDILFYMAKGKVDELFDSETEINQQIQEKIMIADMAKMIIDYQYEYYQSDEVKEVIEELRNSKEVTDIDTLESLKYNLSLYGTIREITDDNVVTCYEIEVALLNEIHQAEQNLPFDSFQELYETIESLKEITPYLYDSVKEKYKPYIENALNKNHKLKENIINQVEDIEQSNLNTSDKVRMIKNLIIDFTKSIIDDAIKEVLKDYTDDLSGTSLEIIDRLISQIDNGLNEINNKINEINNGLDSAYHTIEEKRILLEDAYNLLMNTFNSAKEEIASKRKEIMEYKGFESKINEILIQVNDSVNKEKLLDNIKENELKDVEIIDSYTYDNSPVKNSMNYNIVGLERVSTITPTIFYIIILIILFLFISLMIKQSKQEIAINRLLGKAKNEIRLAFSINNLFVSILGILLGFVIGSLLIMLITNYYIELLQIPKAVYNIDYKSIILCFIITIIVVEIATILATLELDNITPMEVLKKEEYQNTQTSNFTNRITSFLNPFQKFSFLVYIRNKRNFILGIICISSIFAMIFTSLAYVASKDKIFKDYFDERINYNAQIFKTGSISKEEVEDIKSLNYVEDAELLKYINTNIKKDNNEVNVTINAFDDKKDYIRITDQNDKKLTIPEHGIILEQHIAEELDVKKNDSVTIQNVPFKVTDISFQSLGRINYISLEDAKNLKNNLDTIMIKMNNKNQKQLIEKASVDDNYIYTVDYDNLRSYNKKEFDSYNIVAIVTIIFAIVTGFVIVLNLNEYNLVEQKRNLAIFRSLGFQTKEISRNLSIQAIIPWILSLVIGLPIGIILSKYVLKVASSPRREYIYARGIQEIIFTFILIGLFLIIGHFLSMRKLKQINITEEIKERD